MKKIASFTLGEILIVIIISTILIGLSFTVLNLVQRNMWAIQGNLKVNTELNSLEQSLWIDINRYPNASFLDSEDKLVFKSQLDSSVYYFNGDFILKTRDTFHLSIEGKQFYFNGTEITEGTIDALRLELSKKNRSQHLFIFKRNDASQFVN